MKTDTLKKIIAYIESQQQVTAQELIYEFGISAQMIHRHLKKLVENNILIKLGSSPKVFYQKRKQTEIEKLVKIKDSIVEENFVQILPTGKTETGNIAFINWCKKRELEVDRYISLYHETIKKYNIYKDALGLIVATNKASNTFNKDMSLDGLYYGDFSAYEIFGKTKIYNYLLYSKLNQDTKMMNKMFTESKIKDKINNLIKMHGINTICFVPPTVPRKKQLMTELKKFLNLTLPEIKAIKIKTDVLVPQKTLSTTQDRILNSQSTFVVEKVQKEYTKILIIDDFAGTGATINFIAKKIKDKTAKPVKIIGIAICGTPNGVIDNSKKFDIIKEV